jgi:hypothetical protein
MWVASLDSQSELISMWASDLKWNITESPFMSVKFMWLYDASDLNINYSFAVYDAIASTA